MAGCGYVCPVCEGRGYLEDGELCTFCSPNKEQKITEEEWINSVHNDCSCSDIGKTLINKEEKY